MNLNKILFLDIDGVINTSFGIVDPEKRRIAKLNEKPACSQLKRIWKETDCGVVISSSWRLVYKPANELVKKITKDFRLKELMARYRGMTPDLNPGFPSYLEIVDRGVEIEKWVVDNKYQGRFAVVDDMFPYEFRNIKDHLFSVEFREIGITKEIADNIISYLNKPLIDIL